MTPSDEATNEVSAAAGNTGARQYSVSDLPDGSYDIVLFPAENVSVDANGVVTFTDTTPDDNVADWAATEADIEVVNGTAAEASGAGNGMVVDVSPVNGTLTFTIDSQTRDEVVPVVIAADTGSTDGTPDLDLNG